MPAIQSKVRFDGKPAPQDVGQKTKNASRLRNKERSTARRNENALEHCVKPNKKVLVPELDLKGLSSRPQQTNNTRRETPCKAEIPSPTSETVATSHQSANDNELNLQSFPEDVSTADCCLSEVKTSGSVFCLSPYSSLPDVENLDPNHLPDNYFDCDEVDEFYRTQYPDFENSSECTEYSTPKPLDDFPLASLNSVTNSPGVLRHFKELLHQEETSRTNLLQQKEIALLKDIVKADERHRRLQRDDYELLREILISQLKEICQQERVIKIALKKIRSRSDPEVEVTTLRVDSAEQPMEEQKKNLAMTKHRSSPRPPKKAGSCLKTSHQEVDVIFENKALASARSAKDPQIPSLRTPKEQYELMMKGEASARSSNKTPRQEVDIVFKNVPSLEKEIRILRSLGVKLEEVLNKSTEQRAAAPPTQRAIILYEAQKRSIARTSHSACSQVRTKGVRVLSGQAQEFQIRHQTIDELKLEREFFIPTDIDSFALQRTNFHKLSRNPELLLRRLRPLGEGSTMKFNFVEQDPMFFNHFLAKLCNLYAENSECHPTFNPTSFNAHRLQLLKQDLPCLKNGSGDHHPEIKADPPQRFEEAPLKPKTPSNSSVLKRKPKKQYTTPIGSRRMVTAKNRLIRNILLASLPLSMLFTVAAAIWYPDLICP